MRKYSILVLLSLALYSCTQKGEETTNNQPTDSLSYFGDTITIENAQDAKQLTSLMGDKGKMDIKLTGTISKVCQKKGCWMDVDMGNDQKLRVRFKDYAFFVPKDAAGKTTVIEGEAFYDTVTVAELRHYAEDAGQSKEDIEKITDPEISLNFEAKGVIIK
jgi:hypothetical protein